MLDKTIFVTGATRGIGLEIVASILHAGYRVVGIARCSTAGFEAFRAQHQERMQLLEADLATASGLHAVAQAIINCPNMYGLINNAGQAAAGLHITMPRNEMDRLLAINLTAPMVLSQAAMRAMLRKRQGRIVNITSVCAQRPYRGLGTYSATKAAVEGFTRVLAAECGHWGITANCVAPGFIDTAMTASLDTETLQRIQRRSMLPTATTSGDVGGVVSFLLSSAAAAVTAEVIRVDGGSAA